MSRNRFLAAVREVLTELANAIEQLDRDGDEVAANNKITGLLHRIRESPHREERR